MSSGYECAVGEIVSGLCGADGDLRFHGNLTVVGDDARAITGSERQASRYHSFSKRWPSAAKIALKRNLAQGIDSCLRKRRLRSGV